MVEAREIKTKINEARELYRPAAQRTSLFIIYNLHRINPISVPVSLYQSP